MKLSSSLAAILPLLSLAAPAAADGYAHKRELAPHMVNGRRPRGVKTHSHPDIDRVGNATFDQPLNHNDTSKGTFPVRYWYDAASWQGEGSPVFVFNPGETDAEEMIGYLSNETLPGMLADIYGGAVVVIEHRYFGKSIPFGELTAETLQYLNLPNSIHDMTYFAKTVQLPFDDHNHTHPSKVPWVLIGGSYSGALAAWTQHLDPGTYWAYHASSAVVQAIYDFDEYFHPIEEALPRNCSSDVKAVIAYVDDILSNGSEQEVTDLKTLFGLSFLTHHDDFAEQIATPLWKWQTDAGQVFDFCDFIEMFNDGVAVSNANGAGVGLATALTAYATWINNTVVPTCSEYNCDTYNSPKSFNVPTDLSGDRQWDWFLCNEPFAFWQVGPKDSDGTNIVSKYLTTDHWQRRCDLWFPETNGFIPGSTMGFTVEHENMYTGGWNASFERVTFVNGQYDPWIGATLSSKEKPGGPVQYSDEVPIWIINGGIHVPDLVVNELDPNEVNTVEEVYKVIGGWLDKYPYPETDTKRN